MAQNENAAEAESPAFDFISDERFRAALTADYVELVKSLQHGAWKATHVLAGSVVEALLVDYLMSLDYKKRHGKDPLEFDLAKAVDACRSEGVLSEKSANLSTVVRGYRNLIHPGRVVRLQEKISHSTAAVAKALVDIVMDEVAAGRKVKYGLTAAQIMVKLEKDSTVLPILSHLLKETNEHEQERLVTDIIPRNHLEHRDDPSYPRKALEACFKQIFELLPAEKKKVVARRFVAILKEKPEDEVLNYETAFFQAKQLKYVTTEEAVLIREHLLSQISDLTLSKLDALEGIAEFLTPSDARKLFVYLVHAGLLHEDDAVKRRARSMVPKEYQRLPGEKEKGQARIAGEKLLELYKEKGRTDLVEQLEPLIAEMVTEIPL